MIPAQKPKLVVIVGPTAVGKSARAVELARKFDGEIISADSRQIYRGLDIGTGKVTRREMRGVPHHLLDIASPRRQWSAAQYVRRAARALKGVARRGRVPFLVGGTGFYIDALLGTVILPAVPPDRRLRQQLDKLPARELLAELTRLDPARAQTIDAKNPRRLIRAIEVARAKLTKGQFRQPNDYDALWIGLTLSDSELRERVRTRIKVRLRRGLIAEVRHLRENDGLSWRRLDALGLEYRYVARFLRGLLTRGELERVLEQKIWQYARRQKTWFRRTENIHWFRPDEKDKMFRTVERYLLPHRYEHGKVTPQT